MLKLSRSGRVADVIREVRDIPARVIPYAASAALTRTVRRAQSAMVAEMPRVFDRPVAYTLNATRVVPATVQTLSARVAVKDQAAGVVPEHYLLPEVEGGARREKRLERALRYAGILLPGERVMPGDGATLDAAGNLGGIAVGGILRQVQVLQRGGKTIGPGRRKRGESGQLQTVFAGAFGRKGTRGVWLREGRRVTPLLIFTRTQPQYRRRLDFTRIAEQAAREHFPAEFSTAAASILKRKA